MESYYLVQQGDHMSGIAEQHGFASFRLLWDLPENAELKQERRNPHVLFPGDRVFVPAREPAETTGAPGQRHSFRLYGDRLMLRIVVEDPLGKPLAKTECRLTIEGQHYELTSDEKGQIELQIPPASERGHLLISDLEVPLCIGHLDPVEKLSGCAGRLRNLGYHHGAIDDDPTALKSAIEEFQCDHGLTVDGIPGPKTQQNLADVHGC